MCENKMHTCSGERGKDLFPIVNEMYGMAAILSQLINDFPKGFGSISHSFNTWKIQAKNGKKKNKKKEWLVPVYRYDMVIRKTEFYFSERKYLIYIFKHLFLFFLLFKLYLNPEDNHLTESTERTLTNGRPLLGSILNH